MEIEIDEECFECKGTGIYVGMAEHTGYGVQCRKCHGTGEFHFVHKYNTFVGRKFKAGVTHVLECNPGIILGGDELNFGGMKYSEWLKNNHFPIGSEMRNFVCPAWWFQSCNCDLKPDWKECDENLGSTFSNCKYFPTKENCWKRWDKDHNK